jgi:hypothetical protein
MRFFVKSLHRVVSCERRVKQPQANDTRGVANAGSSCCLSAPTAAGLHSSLEHSSLSHTDCVPRALKRRRKFAWNVARILSISCSLPGRHASRAVETSRRQSRTHPRCRPRTARRHWSDRARETGHRCCVIAEDPALAYRDGHCYRPVGHERPWRIGLRDDCQSERMRYEFPRLAMGIV